MVMNLILLVLETVKMLLVMCGCLNYKLKKKCTGAAVLFSVCTILLVIKGIQDSDYLATAFYFIVIVICVMMLEGKRKVLWSVVAYLGICSIDTVTVPILKSAFSASDEEFFENMFLYGGANVISLIGITIATVLLQKCYYGKRSMDHSRLQNSSMIYLILVAVGLFAALIAMMPAIFDDFSLNNQGLVLMSAAVLVFSVVFLVMGAFLIYDNNAKRHYKEVARVNQNLLESKERYYQMLLEKEEETRRFRHDISSHLTCVKRLLEENKTNEAKEYLNGLNGVMHELSVKHQTGNTLVNAIVNDISGKYEKVELNWKGHLPKQIELSDMDICVIFSNLLENAFYAAAGCEAGTVDVTVETVAGTLAITMENTMAGAIDEKAGRLMTQKADKRNHGIGTRNVRDCVEKNEGEIRFEYTENRFTVKVVLINVA